MKIKIGSTRIVFIPKYFNFIIKIPGFIKSENFPSRWWAFILGVYSNLHENLHGNYKNKSPMSNDLAKVYFTDYFGLFLIMEKVEVLDYEFYSNEFYEFMEFIEKKYKNNKFILDDYKPANWGINKEGRLVKIDYGKY